MHRVCATQQRSRANVLTRGPGRMMPARFSGSALATSRQLVGLGRRAADGPQQVQCLGARELFAAETGDEAAAANFALRFLAAQHRAADRATAAPGSRAPADRGTARPNAPAIDRRRLPRGRHALRRWPNAAPAPNVRRHDGAGQPSPPFSAAALGIDQRAQILETIGRHQAGRHQFPQPVLHFACQASGGAHQVREEGRAALLELRQHFAGGVRERRSLALRDRALPANPRSRAGRSRSARCAWAARGAAPAASKAGCGDRRAHITSPDRHS